MTFTFLKIYQNLPVMARSWWANNGLDKWFCTKARKYAANRKEQKVDWYLLTIIANKIYVWHFFVSVCLKHTFPFSLSLTLSLSLKPAVVSIGTNPTFKAVFSLHVHLQMPIINIDIHGSSHLRSGKEELICCGPSSYAKSTTKILMTYS